MLVTLKRVEKSQTWWRHDDVMKMSHKYILDSTTERAFAIHPHGNWAVRSCSEAQNFKKSSDLQLCLILWRHHYVITMTPSLRNHYEVIIT